MLEASDGSYYTGVTTDIERRFAEHTAGARGAKYFHGRAPLRVVYRENSHTRSSACKREAEIKKLSRRQKQLLINDAASLVKDALVPAHE
jgi:putative endonuclease